MESFISMWDSVADKTNKVVGGLWSNDPDGKTYAEMFTKRLNEKGYKVVDAVDSTPVIDIKTYTPRQDVVMNARVPRWSTSFMKG